MQAASLNVWYDISGLGGGVRFQGEIKKALGSSQYLIVVLSPDSVTSEWVEREYLFANSLGMEIIPLFFKSCDLPLFFLSRQYIDVRGKNYKRNYNEILSALDVVLVAPEKKVDTPKPKKERTKRKWDSKIVGILIALGSMLLLIFGLPVLYNQLENTTEPTLTLTKQVIQEPTPTNNITATAEPSSTPSETVNPTATPLSTEITDDLGVEMVLVPAGEFTMGGDPNETLARCQDERNDCNRDETIGPIHQVFLDAFYMDKHEVTNALYNDCVNEGICQQPIKTSSHTHSDYFENPEYGDYPVIYVDWNMANTFCEWRDARLPTEAEWEKAARGTDGRTFPWGEGKPGCDYANLAQICKDGDTSRVGDFVRDVSPYGAYDMAGNIQEWVADWYSEYYYEISPKENPFGPEVGQERVVRGGGWIESKVHPLAGLTYWRGGDQVQDIDKTLGFRCAKGATP